MLWGHILKVFMIYTIFFLLLGFNMISYFDFDSVIDCHLFISLGPLFFLIKLSTSALIWGLMGMAAN